MNSEGLSLQSVWNFSFGTRETRLNQIRWVIRNRLRCDPAGRGNKAWRRMHPLGAIYGNDRILHQ